LPVTGSPFLKLQARSLPSLETGNG